MTIRRCVLLFVLVVSVSATPSETVAQEEFPDSLWNYVQTPWLNFVFGVGVFMDITGFEQDQASKDVFGDLNQGREGEIRGLRGLFAGQVRILGRSYDYLFAGAYRGFDQGFEQQKDNSVTLFDLAVRVPLWSDVQANIGKQKEPFSHDRVQSSLYGPSHERPAHTDALARSRNVGLLVERWSRTARFKWAVGYYNDWLDIGGLSFSDNPWSVIGRVTGVPVDHEADGGAVVHVGGSLNYTNAPVPELASVSAGPEVYFAPNFIQTPEFLWEGAVNTGLEAALITGPLTASGELIHTSVRAPSVGDPTFLGWHAQVGWVITGERREYDRRWGVVSLLNPTSPVGAGGLGAWQLSARVSHLDAFEEQFDGGIMNKYSVNLHWYLSSFTFMMFHVGYADLQRDGIRSGTWISLVRWGIVTS